MRHTAEDGLRQLFWKWALPKLNAGPWGIGTESFDDELQLPTGTYHQLQSQEHRELYLPLRVTAGQGYTRELHVQVGGKYRYKVRDDGSVNEKLFEVLAELHEQQSKAYVHRKQQLGLARGLYQSLRKQFDGIEPHSYSTRTEVIGKFNDYGNGHARGDARRSGYDFELELDGAKLTVKFLSKKYYGLSPQQALQLFYVFERYAAKLGAETEAITAQGMSSGRADA